MIENFIVMPLLGQMVVAIITLLFWGKSNILRYISVVGSSLVLIASIILFIRVEQDGILVMHAANWKPPFGITFVADTFSSLMVLLSSIVGFCISIYCMQGIGTNRVNFGFYTIYHFLLMGLFGAFLTGDLFNLYVWFEVIIISSFVLMTLGGRKAQIEGSIKYVAINLFSSTIFLTGIGLLYGIAGTLNMADLAIKVPQLPNQGLVTIVSIFFILSFGIKSAIFPLYFWLPSSYHTPPSAIAALFGGLLTKVGIYAMLRMFSLVFRMDGWISETVIILAVFTMFVGAFGAINKMNLRKLFSYLIVCHIGFMIGGIGMFTLVSLTGTIFYLIHDIIIKTNLFLITGIIRMMNGSVNMKHLGNMYKEYPKITLIFALVFFSLIGIPPLSGFWPKINFVNAAFEQNQYAFIIGLIFASFITLYVIIKVWANVFWKNKEEGFSKGDNLFENKSLLNKIYLISPIAILMLITLFIGLSADKVFYISKKVATQMIDTQPYIDAVFGH
ncbi:multisubunit sodium/proton antiporter, MrpD subunit [Pseudopedobacter saltans DSM 12145]|uniref:Multisubunit sodium/proton antiporter, MrpD subunit n=1 Tax=Pseudopedobacter saltans (strain ATCC 51119 / DSM 12145 / JCM 21818 / CCUG 39354 / LMG 10337 / NBRC 100064 / NCIMB 13643) TaxID=762903 RepID=F0SE85_PSESL|nr:proton-conducting transporter membrane subunit [Pseudopedobacter saltans]ADY54007.1 multisubunit sodium/proton antiporter, MrpD subunit [Pseudopedobacter saltans DSM 12145]